MKNQFLLCFLLYVFCLTAIAQEQEMLKANATIQVQNAAAKRFNVSPESVDVKLGDRRLVLPNCDQALQVSFPFSDRTTTKVVCEGANWTGYVQIHLSDDSPAFLYRRDLPKGYLIRRGDVIRVLNGAPDKAAPSIRRLNEVLERPLLKKVTQGDVVSVEHFDVEPATIPTHETASAPYGWMVRVTLGRGTRISENYVEWQPIVGRAPSDLLTQAVDLSLFETNRTLVSGEFLRRSNLQLTPAVRKGEEISVTVKRGALTVTTQLITLESGAVGDEIRVINKESKRELVAKVTGVRMLELL